MRKRCVKYICFVLTAVFLFLAAAPFPCEAANAIQTGITLDCARRYYSVEDIKKYIRLLSDSPAPFLQLHLTDDENVGVECVYLGQTVKAAKKLSDGSYRNKQTKQKFLSRKQIRELLRYAARKGVEIVPEIDMPAHMEGFFRLARGSLGAKYVKQISADAVKYPGELKIAGKKAIGFAKKLYAEYAELFAGCRYFHMGCDEFSSATQKQIVSYINTMSDFLEKKGFTVRIWNDLLRKDNIDKINSKIQVTYWSYDGDAQSASVRKQRRKERASVRDLQKKGFDILNYNSYYLYFTPSKENCNRSDRDYRVNDVEKNWNLKKWDGDSGKTLSGKAHMIGAAVSVWGEDSSGVSADTIYKQVKPLYQAMKNKIKGLQKRA